MALDVGAANSDIADRLSTATVKDLLRQFSSTRRPIEVDLRKLVHWVRYGDRITHFIHPYPAKLLPHIPAIFSRAAQFSEKKSLVIDPFGGSGTVALESILSGRNAVSLDCNPLAVLISRVKTTPIDEHEAINLMRKILLAAKRSSIKESPDVINLEHWFYPHVVRDLSILTAQIRKIESRRLRNFFEVCLSNCARRLSLADQRLSVPVRLNPAAYPRGHELRKKIEVRVRHLRVVNVFGAFEDVVQRNLVRHRDFSSQRTAGVTATTRQANILSKTELRQQRKIASNAQLIVTSPPYLGAQKYIRASSLGLGWLGLCPSDGLRELERQTIGREHLNKSEYQQLHQTGVDKADNLLGRVWKESPLRAQMASLYLREMRVAVRRMKAMLAPGGNLVLVLGNNFLAGRIFDTVKYVSEIALDEGFRLKLHLVDHIRSRGLMTKRNVTAGLIESESVMILGRA